MRPAKLVRGYTLRDLFVVTAAVGMLCALATQVVVTERGPSRRNTCANNLRNISMATNWYEAAHGHYPGHANTMSGKKTTFIVPLLPYLERNDVYASWSDPTIMASQAAQPYMDLLVCPSNRTTACTPGENSYAVNAGEASHEIPADGVCFDRTRADGLRAEVSLAFVNAHDGAAKTILMSENLQARSWVVQTAGEAKRNTGLVWFNGNKLPTQCYINRAKNTPIGADAEISFARPSSNHAGGVNVTFCDGHLRFIGDQIDYNVYKQLMTPDGANSSDSVNRSISEDVDY